MYIQEQPVVAHTSRCSDIFHTPADKYRHKWIYEYKCKYRSSQPESSDTEEPEPGR